MKSIDCGHQTQIVQDKTMLILNTSNNLDGLNVDMQISGHFSWQNRHINECLLALFFDQHSHYDTPGEPNILIHFLPNSFLRFIDENQQKSFSNSHTLTQKGERRGKKTHNNVGKRGNIDDVKVVIGLDYKAE